MMSGFKSGKKGKIIKLKLRLECVGQKMEIPAKNSTAAAMWLEAERDQLYSELSGEAGEEHENNMKYLGRI